MWMTILFIVYSVFIALVILYIAVKCFFKFYLDSSGNLFMDLKETPPKSPEEIESIMKKSLFETEKELEEDYDVVIIGSGISASSAANILSRAGKRVLMLEKHDRLGGYGHSFEEGEFEFCAGVHFLVKYDDEAPLPFLMNFLTDGQFNVFSIGEKMIEHYELGGTEVKVKGGDLKVMEGQLINSFPEEKEELKKYFNIIRKHAFSLAKFVGARNAPWIIKFLMKYIFCYDDSSFHEYGRKNVRNVLDECGIQNEALRFLLMSSQLLFNSNGDDYSCFPLHAAVTSMYNDKSIPLGGGKKVAESIITNLKGKSLGICNCEVKRILFSKNLRGGLKAKGIELSSGQKIMCDTIISSAGVENTLNMVSTKKRETHFQILNRLLQKHRNYNGKLFTIFVGLDASPEELGMKGVGCYIYSANEKWDNFQKMKALSPPEFDGFEDCAYVYVSIIDQFIPNTDDEEDDEPNQKKQTKLTVFSVLNDEWFTRFEGTRTKFRRSDYEEIKNNLTDLILEKVVYKRFPKMIEHVRVVEAGTTLTFKDYGGWPEGSSYGLTVSYDKLCDFVGNPEVENPCEGLHLVGQDVMSPGVGMAVLSTFGALGKILKRNLYIDFLLGKRKYMKKRMKEMKKITERNERKKKKV